MVSCWVVSTISRVTCRLGQRMRTTLHAAEMSHRQSGPIVTIKMAWRETRRTARNFLILTIAVRPINKLYIIICDWGRRSSQVRFPVIQWESAIKILDRIIDIPVTRSLESKACSELDFINHCTIYSTKKRK